MLFCKGFISAISAWVCVLAMQLEWVLADLLQAGTVWCSWMPCRRTSGRTWGLAHLCSMMFVAPAGKSRRLGVLAPGARVLRTSHHSRLTIDAGWGLS